MTKNLDLDPDPDPGEREAQCGCGHGSGHSAPGESQTGEGGWSRPLNSGFSEDRQLSLPDSQFHPVLPSRPDRKSVV